MKKNRINRILIIRILICSFIWIWLTGFKAVPYIMLHAPSDVIVGESFDLTAVCFKGDDEGNLLLNYDGTIHFVSTDPDIVLPVEYTFTTADQGRHTFNGLVFTKPGIYQIRAIEVSETICSEIIPIPVRCHSRMIDLTKKMNKVYWGEFHGHTGISSDGIGDPTQFYHCHR